MKGLFQGSNRIYCLTNIFVCLLCTGYLCTGYCSINSEIQQEDAEVLVENDVDPLSDRSEIKEKVVNATKVKIKQNKEEKKVVVTTSKTNTSSKKYVKPNYDSVTGSAVVNYAKNYLGLRYVSGGNSLTKGTDCSGFTKLIYKEFGITLSRSVKAQAKNGTYVKKSDLQKGDLIFYGYKSGVVSHVAIYIGNGKVIHQSTPKSGVKINTMNMMVYITARRVITKPATQTPSKEEVKEENTNTSINNNNNIDNSINNSTNNNVNNEVNNKVENNVENNNVTNNNTSNDIVNNNTVEENTNTDIKVDNYTSNEYEN